jgi:zinc D-Ala-D-Ala dipeptidase
MEKNSDLVAVGLVIPDLEIEMPLATADNPFGFACYRPDATLYLRYGTACKVAQAQRLFMEKGYRLKMWDAYRPFVVQEKLFHAVGGNNDWVSDPYSSRGKKTHVRAVAVDVTLVDAEGKELEMPTRFDDFETTAERMQHDFMDLPEQVIKNRALLRATLEKVGMEPYEGEWWHYQDNDWEDYPVIGKEEYPEIHKQLLVDELLG